MRLWPATAIMHTSSLWQQSPSNIASNLLPAPSRRLVQLRLGEPEAALAVFKKLHGLLPDSPEVLQQLAACCEAADDLEAAVQWLEVAASVVPNDSGVMVRLGALHARWASGLHAGPGHEGLSHSGDAPCKHTPTTPT
jgi:Flp pilus assembly protein TadD